MDIEAHDRPEPNEDVTFYQVVHAKVMEDGRRVLNVPLSPKYSTLKQCRAAARRIKATVPDAYVARHTCFMAFNPDNPEEVAARERMINEIKATKGSRRAKSLASPPDEKFVVFAPSRAYYWPPEPSIACARRLVQERSGGDRLPEWHIVPLSSTLDENGQMLILRRIPESAFIPNAEDNEGCVEESIHE